MNSKKILALVLAFAMMFSTISTVFADTTATIGADAEALKTIGVLKGDTADGVTADYLAKTTTRMQAAIMFLRLKGLEEEAMAFTGTDNFADADTMTWGEGKAVMAYLKANPQLGWVGADAGKFNPFETITVAQYYKVMLEALGYKQTTAEVAGDFEWKDVMTFAASKGLVKLAANTNFTNNDLAVATIEGLKANVNGTTTTLAAAMVDAGMINKAAAVAAGLYEEEVAVTVAVDEAIALGNTVVEVEFEDDVDAAAAGNVNNYTIEGLAINSAVVTGDDTVRLVTAAQTAGKLYTLTVGEKSVTFAGIAKVSGGPEITDVYSEDVEEVVIEFDKNLDYTAATNVANYTIAGVEITKAEVDGDEVTLTTVGLKDNTNYTVKVNNMVSVDGVSRKTASDSFRSNFDTAYPRIDTTNTKVETNQRIVLYFNEEVTKESAENIANYTLKVNETDGAELEIISATWDDDDENSVEIVTEAMEKNESYKLSVSNIADQRKVANVMTRPATFTFKGVAEDDDAPTIKSVSVIAKNLLVVEFEDDSRIDEESVLDLNNYTFTKGSDNLDVESIETLKDETGTFKALVTVEEMEAGKKYDLEVVDVLDEFGNAMKEDSKTVNPDVDEFASAKLTGVTVNSKNTITLIFDKELKEASAENIANYSFDGGIGTPTKAVYEKDGAPAKSVTLTVNELTNGEKYDLTIDGVIDLAGNVLKSTKKDIVATAGSNWDEDKPELEDAYAENKYVAALQFSEEITIEDGTKLVLTDEDGNVITLEAKATTEDDTVVEFSHFDGTAWTVLDESKNYTVTSVVYGAGNELGSVKDLVGNAFTTSDDEFTFDGSSDDPDYAEVDSYDQINGGTFEVTMSRNVKFADGVALVDGVATVNGFKVSIDEDDKNIVSFVGNIEEDKSYDFNLATLLVDEHGMAVINADEATKTIFEGDETDEDAPYIVGVEATDRKTVEIEFNEDIMTALTGDFKIKNVDLDKNVTITAIEIDENVVTLTLSTALEGRYEYELTMTDDVLDFAGNNTDADTYSFDGSDLAE